MTFTVRPAARERPSGARHRPRRSQLLDFLHRHGQPIRVGDLARMLQAPRSSMYEIVRTLTGGWAPRRLAPDGAIFFGRTLYFYGMDYLREHDAVRRGRDEVDRLAAETGETSQYCMLNNGQYTVVHMRAGSRPFRISSDIGTQIPRPGQPPAVCFSRISTRMKSANPCSRRISRCRMDRRSRWRTSSLRSGPRANKASASPLALWTPIRIASPRPCATTMAARPRPFCFVVPIDTAPERIAAAPRHPRRKRLVRSRCTPTALDRGHHGVNAGVNLPRVRGGFARRRPRLPRRLRRPASWTRPHVTDREHMGLTGFE